MWQGRGLETGLSDSEVCPLPLTCDERGCQAYLVQVEERVMCPGEKGFLEWVEWESEFFRSVVAPLP